MLLFAFIAAAVYLGIPQVVSRFQSTKVATAPREEESAGQQKPATVVKPTADVRIKSEPAGARIFINGDFKGTTPAELALPLGNYEIRIHLENHRDWEARVQLSEPGQMPLFVKLTPN
jgi:hypothetical protein